MGSIAFETTAKAVRFHGQKDLRFDEIPVPTTLQEGEIRLRPAWCGICGTDVHEYLHGPVFPPAIDKPHPLTGHTMPVVLGHEFSGTVLEVHPSVTRVAVGDKVAIEGLLTDDTCYACSISKRNICDNSAFLGLSGGFGGLCETVVIPSSTCHKLPASISLEIGALVEPLSVAWHAVSQSGIVPGQSAIVFGAGPIGLAVILCLKAKGIEKILASEPSKKRHEQAVQLGAVATFDPMKDDVVAGAKKICDG
jgi:(R,R)-butanediol dehydrogenase/meso-butanediol dehydrogenase/diacetyl reductase